MKTANSMSFFYFVAIVFLGSDYLLNLILAVVSMAYSKQQKLLEEMVQVYNICTVYYSVINSIKDT